MFRETYLELDQPYRITSYHIDRNERDEIQVHIDGPKGPMTLRGGGQGTLEALVDGIDKAFGIRVEIVNYSEQAVGNRTDAEAATCVQLRAGGKLYTGVALHRDTVVAVINAVLVAFNQIIKAESMALAS